VGESRRISLNGLNRRDDSGDQQAQVVRVGDRQVLGLSQFGLLFILISVDCSLDALPVVHNLVHEHLWSVLGVEAWCHDSMYTSLVTGNFWQFDASIRQLFSLQNQLLLLSLVLLDLFLEDVGD